MNFLDVFSRLDVGPLTRYVLQWFQEQADLRRRLKYRAVQIICAAHRANLVTASAVCGHPVRNAGDHEVCASATRIFKYLVPFYCDEFASHLRQVVVERLTLLEDPPEIPAWQGLVALYGDKVFPSELLRTINGDLLGMSCCKQDGVSLQSARGKVYNILFRSILIAESKPILSRFWLFGPCCCAMLLIHFFNLAGIFRTDTAQPQPENVKRIQRVQAFFASADSMQQLKRAALGLRISQIAVSLSGLKKQDDIPLLVRFGRKEVQRRGCEELRKIILLLDEDMDLHRTDATVHLLVTTIQLFLRFAPYQDYPMAGWQLTAKYNEDFYLLKIEEFLQMDASALDTGFFLPLRNDAQKQGNYSDQINFMLSQEVQTLLTQFIEAAPGSSLDVERKHNVDKQSEKNHKIMSVSAASRNSILQHFSVFRAAHLKHLKGRKKVAKKMLKMNSRALAVQRNPQLLPRPRGLLSGGSSRDIVHEGDPGALAQYLQTHRATLVQEAKALRERSKENLQENFHGVPLTHQAWMTWIENHEDEFKKELKDASERRKNLYNRKLEALPGLQCFSRLAPKATELPRWTLKFMYGKHGPFFLLRWRNGQRLKLCLSSVGQLCFGFELATPPGTHPHICFFDTDNCFASFKSLRDILSGLPFPTDDLEPDVYELKVEAGKMSN